MSGGGPLAKKHTVFHCVARHSRVCIRFGVRMPYVLCKFYEQERIIWELWLDSLNVHEVRYAEIM